VLLKFADVDVFDIEVNSHDPEKIIGCSHLRHSGINLEDESARFLHRKYTERNADIGFPR
jgi:malic enzyme